MGLSQFEYVPSHMGEPVETPDPIGYAAIAHFWWFETVALPRVVPILQEAAIRHLLRTMRTAGMEETLRYA